MGAPSYEAASEFARLMKLFTHPYRLRIVNALAADGPASPTRLSERFGDLTIGDCNYHLGALRSGGAVALAKSRNVRGAKERIYRIEPLPRWPFNSLLLPILRELVPAAAHESFEPFAVRVTLDLDERGTADAAAAISAARSKATEIAVASLLRCQASQDPRDVRSAVLITGTRG